MFSESKLKCNSLLLRWRIETPLSTELPLEMTDYAVIAIAIRLRSDYDVSRAPASIRRELKMNMSIFRRTVSVS